MAEYAAYLINDQRSGSWKGRQDCSREMPRKTSYGGEHQPDMGVRIIRGRESEELRDQGGNQGRLAGGKRGEEYPCGEARATMSSSNRTRAMSLRRRQRKRQREWRRRRRRRSKGKRRRKQRREGRSGRRKATRWRKRASRGCWPPALRNTPLHNISGAVPASAKPPSSQPRWRPRTTNRRPASTSCCPCARQHIVVLCVFREVTVQITAIFQAAFHIVQHHLCCPQPSWTTPMPLSWHKKAMAWACLSGILQLSTVSVCSLSGGA